MSTRSCIARRKGDGFEGVYHHWDGYPTALGATLVELAASFQDRGGLPAMLKMLIDDHPAGWSTINGADWSLEPGFEHLTAGGRSKRPACFCHGDRQEPGDFVTHESYMGMEWAYVFDEDAGTMAVCERVYGDGAHNVGMFGTLGSDHGHWAVRAVINVMAPGIIDWEDMQS